jgi:hypothetical protein
MTSLLPDCMREHLTLVVSIAGGIAIIVRLLSAAALQPETALIILQTQGTSAVIVGTLLPVLALLPGMVAIIVLLSTFGTRPINTGRLTIGLCLLAFTAMMVPLGTIAMLAVLPLVIVAIYFVRRALNQALFRLARRARDQVRLHKLADTLRYLDEFRERTGRIDNLRGGALISGGLLVIVLFGSPPWLPTERIDGPTGPITGYVLADGNDELIVLQDSPRIVVRLPAAETKRAYCTRPAKDQDAPLTRFVNSGRPLLFVVSDSPDAAAYPRCPAPK